MENTKFDFYLLLTDGAFIFGWVVLDVSNFTTLFISEAIFDLGPLEKLNIFWLLEIYYSGRIKSKIVVF